MNLIGKEHFNEQKFCCNGHEQQVKFIIIICSGLCGNKSKYCFPNYIRVQWLPTATLEPSSLCTLPYAFSFYFSDQKYILNCSEHKWNKRLHFPHKPFWRRNIQNLDSIDCHQHLSRANLALAWSLSLSNGDSLSFGLWWKCLACCTY